MERTAPTVVSCATCSTPRSAPCTAEGCLPAFLPAAAANGRTIVIGAGKGAAAMARAVEAHWPRPAVGPGGHALRPCGAVRSASRSSRPPIRCPTRPANAPRSASSTLVAGLTENDLVLCLISGGGSALLALPAEA